MARKWRGWVRVAHPQTGMPGAWVRVPGPACAVRELAELAAEGHRNRVAQALEAGCGGGDAFLRRAELVVLPAQETPNRATDATP